MLNILVVEDHDLLREAMVGVLSDGGHRAQGVYCAEEVAAAESATRPDVYIVDLNLPGEDGLSLAARLRKQRPDVGIVIVSARNDVVDRVAGYKAGANVYLTKPFEIDELLAVIEALGERFRQESATPAYVLNRTRTALSGPTGEALLTLSEVQLLAGFCDSPDMTLSHDEVAVFLNLGTDATSRATLNVRLSQLRRKLSVTGAPEPTIRAIRGSGYKLCLPLKVT